MQPEITAAIKKILQDKAFDFTIANPEKSTAECYTCGGEDAIGFMLKFVEWISKEGWHPALTNGNWVNAFAKQTTEQLLIKYLENNKL